MEPTWCQSGAKVLMGEKYVFFSQICAQMEPEWSQNGVKFEQKTKQK